MFQATFRPIDRWTGPQTKGRRRSTFRAPYADTLNLLESEIGKLRGNNVVIQAYFAARDIRNDGWPRSSARPSQPGIIVTFRTSKGPLSFPCDTFDAWEDNLRAIAKSLEALRTVDRYGVTKSNEQYKGFAQIAAPASTHSFSTVSDAVLAIRQIADEPLLNPAASEDHLGFAYRSAARKAHPDNGGNGETFLRLQAARKYIADSYGWTL